MMHGRPPVHHPWPLSQCLAKVDISDPHTFLAIKRGILQYAYLKPILGVATIIMKATNTYKEGYLGVDSGYLWSGILYNLSVTLSLYSLAMFWVCMSQDLQPFRPLPKFLCIKLIIFASYWQGFFLSILQWLGAIPNDVAGYTADNLAAAIQDALICCEMPLFAISHWYAFSWHDYADVTISAARMPVKYALRDAFGVRDLIEDTKETFGGKHYEYRSFDTGDNVLAHEESDSRVARMMEGMRYERGGKGKYWIPKPGEPTSRTPLLGAFRSGPPSRPRNMSPSKGGRLEDERGPEEMEESTIDPEDESLFASARVLEYGDWNYPVITAHVPSADRWLTSDPNLITTSTNRNILQPTKKNKRRRESDIQKTLDKGKHRAAGSRSRARAPIVEDTIREESSESESGRSQLVDLIIEDHHAEDMERVRARKEGGPEWNEHEAKQFMYFSLPTLTPTPFHPPSFLKI
ncbi:Organic solute transporter subunit alpha/Transmembrane protein 184 [Lasallia pustulata]|uniref:Organic solute transporter subunit alpha/Transmembrane protein 184 n=1 Tax=Lasallia pustulata TaxID=136370 RepID=A0A1W5DAR8_9LECA|nr:Organic solute transporter subunit alpha/Transmembrane protein 184 [Lasallia pustulata]